MLTTYFRGFQKILPRAFSTRRYLAATLVAILTLALLAPDDAEARRLGGSRSIGRQSANVTQQARPPAAAPTSPQAAGTQSAAAARPAAATPAATPARNRWLAPLAGIAAGLGIAALLSHLGLGGVLAGFLANVIVIALLIAVVVWLWRMVMRRRGAQPPAYAAGNTAWSEPTVPNQAPTFTHPITPLDDTVAPATSLPWGVPADFDSAAFIHNAKVYFVRLQAAWDRGDLDDLREFTTPEMFAEASVEMTQRGSTPNRTDVVRLDAELLGIEERETEHLASVHFSGLLREQPGTPAEPFTEVWNLSKRKLPDSSGEGWLLAGIQQIAPNLR